MRIADLGEFGLIALVQEWTRDDAPAAGEWYQSAVDNGDDAAAITLRQASVTELYTTDTMVDGVHFTAATTPWRDLGWKAMASNISDIAAMGGTPGVALVTLGLPPDTAVPDIKEMYAGMMDICRQYQARIIGGDVVRSPVCFVTVALTGFARHRPLTRTAARPGHQVAVSGPVGGSAGGLRTLLTQPMPPAAAADAIAAADSASAELIRCHRRPQPHIAAGQRLAAAAAGPSGSAATDLAADIATATDIAAMDISDGLADDLGKLCAASGVAAVIKADAVPAPPALRQAFPDDWLDLALYGGEDYALLFTAPPAVMDATLPLLPPGAAVIGAITDGAPGQVAIIDGNGAVRPGRGAGWDHFAG